ncbi:cupredoxin family protein [Rugamonas sp. A1-17]|nr:cupredoxin family protein [Rugamonas sp. A1-17]
MKNISAAISLALFSSMLSLAAAAASGDQMHGTAHQHGAHDHGAPPVGKPGDPAQATRTVVVDMNDTMRFSPSTITVKQGEVVRFVVKNSGKLKHEIVIGSASELKEHAQMMAKFPEMEHAEANQVTLAPGMSGHLVWQFDSAGKVEFACLQPGHFEAGMKGIVVVDGKM